MQTDWTVGLVLEVRNKYYYITYRERQKILTYNTIREIMKISKPVCLTRLNLFFYIKFRLFTIDREPRPCCHDVAAVRCSLIGCQCNVRV